MNVKILLIGIIFLLSSSILLILMYNSIKEFITDIKHYFKYKAGVEDLIWSYIQVSIYIIAILFFALIIINACG